MTHNTQKSSIWRPYGIPGSRLGYLNLLGWLHGLFHEDKGQVALAWWPCDLASPQVPKRKWHPTPVLLPGESHGWRSLVGYSPWGHTESDMTEQLHSLTHYMPQSPRATGCILSPCFFNLYAEYSMRNAGLEEAQAGIKIAGRNINNLRYTDDTTLMAESEEKLKSLLMKVKEKVKSLSHVRLFVTPWTVAHQASPSMGSSRHEYWEWVAISFSRGSARPRGRARVSRVVGRRFTV